MVVQEGLFASATPALQQGPGLVSTCIPMEPVESKSYYKFLTLTKLPSSQPDK